MKKCVLLLSVLTASLCTAVAQTYKIESPDKKITVEVKNSESLTYSVTFDGKVVVAESPMGFQFKGEPDMSGNFEVKNDAKVKSGIEAWTPVVRNKHAECSVPYNELALVLKEKSGQYRKMDLTFRVMNDGVAFRYGLYGVPVLGNREIMKELTGYNIPEESSLWIPDFAYEDEGKSYKSSQEGVFIKTPVKDIKTEIHAGLPGLIEIDKENYLAVMEADLNNFPAFYLGRNSEPANGYQMLETKLTPIWGCDETGPKARFAEKVQSSWRVVMVGHNPGKFIESEILRSLNPECKIADTSWIKPGMCAWDHWWSAECKMEQDVIKQYIDLASHEGWPYMLIDWTWYGPYCVPEADILDVAPQLNMPEIISYANSKNVDIWLWLRCEDANNNDQYKDAFSEYHKWGVKGVKIDFMDRDDQDMVNWYHRIIKACADNQLMLDLHGAYKPDGIERTYPNMLTREGVLGAENYKWGEKMTPEHNVTLAYTRLLTGQMDYTPGGFLNVTAKEFKGQSPTLVSNTRAAELSKFVIYESPYTVVCDHPDNIYNQVGEDFLQIVPTTWDDIKFIGGTIDTYVALAKKSGNSWFIGALNNSQGRTIALDLSFLPNGKYTIEYWADGKNANKKATDCVHKSIPFTVSDKNKTLKVNLANAGGYVAVIK